MCSVITPMRVAVASMRRRITSRRSPLALRSSLLARAEVFHKPADLPLGAKPRTRNTKARAPGPVYNVSVADYHTDIVGSPSGASPFDRTIRGCRAGPVAGKSLQELLP